MQWAWYIKTWFSEWRNHAQTKNCFLKKLSLSLLIFSDENIIAKLVGDMCIIVLTDCISFCAIESEHDF